MFRALRSNTNSTTSSSSRNARTEPPAGTEPPAYDQISLAGERGQLTDRKNNKLTYGDLLKKIKSLEAKLEAETAGAKKLSTELHTANTKLSLCNQQLASATQKYKLADKKHKDEIFKIMDELREEKEKYSAIVKSLETIDTIKKDRPDIAALLTKYIDHPQYLNILNVIKNVVNENKPIVILKLQKPFADDIDKKFPMFTNYTMICGYIISEIGYECNVNSGINFMYLTCIKKSGKPSVDKYMIDIYTDIRQYTNKYHNSTLPYYSEYYVDMISIYDIREMHNTNSVSATEDALETSSSIASLKDLLVITPEIEAMFK